MLWCLLGVALATEELLVGKVYNLQQSESLRTYHIRTNYQRTEISVTFSVNLKSVQWSDQLTNIYQCSPSSAICGRSCISDMYIVVDADKDAAFVFNAVYLDGACDPVVENDYTFCGALGYDDCDRCDSKCRLAECFSKQDEIVAKMCLPSHIEMSEMEDRCYSIKDAVSYDWRSECKHSEANASSVGTILLICCFVALFVAFVGSVAWYHWRLRKTGQPPMTCPKFCPRALFPQPEAKQPPRSSYSPPEFYSD